MKIYSDKERTQEVKSVDFGIVEVGQTKDLIFYVYNNTQGVLKKLEFKFGNTQVEVVSAPMEIAPESIEVLKIRWTPNLKLKEGLKTSLTVEGVEIYG